MNKKAPGKSAGAGLSAGRLNVHQGDRDGVKGVCPHAFNLVDKRRDAVRVHRCRCGASRSGS